jgi:hypothetical protein
MSQLSHSELALSELRITVRSYFIELNEKFKKYESIKDLFKRYANLARQYDKAGQEKL